MKKLLLIVFSLTVVYVNGQKPINISSDFPGGNIIVNRISEDTVWLKPDSRLTEGEWFYWYFKISGIAGRKITFQFEQDNVFAKYGPAYSLNNNHTWKWYGENRTTDNHFTYTFDNNDTVAYFSVAFPYTEKHFNDFLSGLHKRKKLKIETLCRSPENRKIEKITILPLNSKPKHKVLITARHHACEMMASYELEGIIQGILNQKDLAYLRKNVEFLIIPFMDKDGVENGEQGKNRRPRDHNRDYSGKTVHNSTAALRKMVPEWNNGKIKIALDLHCPWIHSGINEVVYLVGSSDSNIEKKQILFSELLENNSTGEIKAYRKDFLSFGTSWNTKKNYSQGASFRKWAGGLEGISLASTIEFPYANISGKPVTKDGARVFGKAVARSIQEYIKSLE